MREPAVVEPAVYETVWPRGQVNPDKLSIETRVNGQTVQQSNTADMIFDVRSLVSFLSESTTLLPGLLPAAQPQSASISGYLYRHCDPYWHA